MKKSKFSILYAEDDDKIREKYVKFLKMYFKNVYKAIDGQEALDLYEKYNPDVIILDINMPIIDGLQVAKTIRKKDKQVQILMLTAYSEKEKLLLAIELSLIKYLIKPIQTFELEEIIVNCIDTLEADINKEDLVVLDGEFIWNKAQNSLYKNNEMIKLTQKELLLLKLFCSNPNQTFSNIDIMNYVWEDDIQSDFNTNKLRVLFSKLKTKLAFNLFDSIYNVGYKIKKISNM